MENKKVAIKDHPKYNKFFNMVQVGIPKEVVKGKMEEEGCDGDLLDKDCDELISLYENVPEGTVIAVSEHPIYQKYFKMLKSGVSKEAVMNKMKLEGVDPSMIDKKPDEVVYMEEKQISATDNNNNSTDNDNESVKVSDHPIYNKYFKMLKVITL